MLWSHPLEIHSDVFVRWSTRALKVWDLAVKSLYLAQSQWWATESPSIHTHTHTHTHTHFLCPVDRNPSCVKLWNIWRNRNTRLPLNNFKHAHPKLHWDFHLKHESVNILEFWSVKNQTNSDFIQLTVIVCVCVCVSFTAVLLWSSPLYLTQSHIKWDHTS